MKTIFNQLSKCALGFTTTALLTSVASASLARVEVINATSDSVVMQLAQGSVIDLSKSGTSLSVKAVPSVSVGSVVFTLDGVRKVENKSPYVYFGDNSGDIIGGSIAPGSHTLKVATYSSASGGGSLLSSTTLSFSVVQPTASAGSAAAWILNHFANAPVKTGTFTSRQNVETPVIVKNASASGGKYGFAFYNRAGTVDHQSAVVNTRITNLKSSDNYGAAVLPYDEGGDLYIADLYIEPNWPKWIDYNTTNYDGINLTHGTHMYAENVTIKNWNADSAVDSKAVRTEWVNLQVSGAGNRSMRFWAAGTHYIVNSSISNPGGLGNGLLFWVNRCSDSTFYIYNSSFNGSSTIPMSKFHCESGTPRIIYLNHDPRTTGEMHPMFRAQ